VHIDMLTYHKSNQFQKKSYLSGRTHIYIYMNMQPPSPKLSRLVMALRGVMEKWRGSSWPLNVLRWPNEGSILKIKPNNKREWAETIWLVHYVWTRPEELSGVVLQSNRVFSCEQHCNIVPQYAAICKIEIHKRFVNKASDWTIRKREAPIQLPRLFDWLPCFL
jgi:hypothetical protein